MFTDIELKILDYLMRNQGSASSEIHDGINVSSELITTKRKLSNLLNSESIYKIGIGRATKYYINEYVKYVYSINLDSYFDKDVDDRIIIERFDIDIIKKIIPNIELFTSSELEYLKQLQNKYIDNISTISNTLYKKDLERLGIDLSWKSSQIEGNTYSLLETEQLLKESVEAKGKKKEEAYMLLNHKNALHYILDSPNYFLKLDLRKIIEVHSILVNNLNVEKNIRKRLIGITGTNYGSTLICVETGYVILNEVYSTQ